MKHADWGTTAKHSRHAERNLWLAWVISTSVSAGAGWALASAILSLLGNGWGLGPDWVALYGFIAAIVIASWQLLVLRLRLSYSLCWLILTPLSGAIGSFAGWYAIVYITFRVFDLPWIGQSINGATFGLVGGLVVGIVQYAIMAKSGHRNQRWIWATTLGGALGIGLGFPVFYLSLSSNTPEWMIMLFAGGGGIVAGAVGGAVTGLALIRMLRQARARTVIETTPMGASLPGAL
jgi:hypothetical protein